MVFGDCSIKDKCVEVIDVVILRIVVVLDSIVLIELVCGIIDCFFC